MAEDEIVQTLPPSDDDEPPFARPLIDIAPAIEKDKLPPPPPRIDEDTE